MKFLLLFVILVLFSFKISAQVVQYKYDKIGRLLQATYSDQKSINYTYDKDGNRLSQIISTVITSVSTLNDSLLRVNSGVFIYPNPSNGNFKTRIYSSQKQTVSLQIYTLDGKLIHTYTAEVLKGYYDININISPQPTGTYTVVVKGRTINASKKVIITQ